MAATWGINCPLCKKLVGGWDKRWKTPDPGLKRYLHDHINAEHLDVPPELRLKAIREAEGGGSLYARLT